MTALSVALPDGRVWLRVADPAWAQPLDPSFARRAGGRWNAPGSYNTLYMNADVVTARLQLERLCAGTPVTIDDLDDEAYVLIAATLPTAKRAADAISGEGLAALSLPMRYPLDEQGRAVPWQTCQTVGAHIREAGFQGVWSRSACTDDGRGREVAWFPEDGERAHPLWDSALPLGSWRYANSWNELNLTDQPDPSR